MQPLAPKLHEIWTKCWISEILLGTPRTRSRNLYKPKEGPLYGRGLIRPCRRWVSFLVLYVGGFFVLGLCQIASGETVCDDDSSLLICGLLHLGHSKLLYKLKKLGLGIASYWVIIPEFGRNYLLAKIKNASGRIGIFYMIIVTCSILWGNYSMAWLVFCN